MFVCVKTSRLAQNRYETGSHVCLSLPFFACTHRPQHCLTHTHARTRTHTHISSLGCSPHPTCSCHVPGNKRHAVSVTRDAWAKVCQGSSRGRRQCVLVSSGPHLSRPKKRSPAASPPSPPPQVSLSLYKGFNTPDTASDLCPCNLTFPKRDDTLDRDTARG